MNLKDLVLSSKKALVAPAVAGILFLLSEVGVTGEMTVREAVTLLVTGVIVYFTRNKKV